MLSFNCKGKINVVESKGDYIGVGCSDGWVYLFKGDELLWENKLSSTYYRDPYTDVNVLSVCIEKNTIGVGTDFMDGKIYIMSFDGDILWYRQFLTIVGCWERPDDVVAIAIGDDRIVVGTEWINSYVHQLNLKGESVNTFRVDGKITDIAFWKDFVIGTDRGLYFNKFDKHKLKLNVRGLAPLEDVLVVFSDSGIYTINREIRRIYKSGSPLAAASLRHVVCYDEKLVALSRNGDILWSCEVEKPVKILCDDRVYLGYNNLLKIVEDGEIVGEFKIKGLPIELTENFIVSTEDRTLHIYPLSEILRC